MTPADSNGSLSGFGTIACSEASHMLHGYSGFGGRDSDKTNQSKFLAFSMHWLWRTKSINQKINEHLVTCNSCIHRDGWLLLLHEGFGVILRWVRGEAVAPRCWRCWIKFRAMTSWAKTSDSSLTTSNQLAKMKMEGVSHIRNYIIHYIYIILHRIPLISFDGLVIDPGHQVEISPVLLCTVGPASQEHVGFLVQSLREAWNHVCKISFQLGGRQGKKNTDVHVWSLLFRTVVVGGLTFALISTQYLVSWSCWDEKSLRRMILRKYTFVYHWDFQHISTLGQFFFEITDRAGSVHDLSPELEEEHVTWWHTILVDSCGHSETLKVRTSLCLSAQSLRGDPSCSLARSDRSEGIFTDEKKGGLRVLDFHFKTHQHVFYISNICMEEWFRWFSDSPKCREKWFGMLVGSIIFKGVIRAGRYFSSLFYLQTSLETDPIPHWGLRGQSRWLQGGAQWIYHSVHSVHHCTI